MDRFHEMVIEDEIVMCGAILLLGIVLGVAARVLAFLKQKAAL